MSVISYYHDLLMQGERMQQDATEPLHPYKYVIAWHCLLTPEGEDIIREHGRDTAIYNGGCEYIWITSSVEAELARLFDCVQKDTQNYNFSAVCGMLQQLILMGQPEYKSHMIKEAQKCRIICRRNISLSIEEARETYKRMIDRVSSPRDYPEGDFFFKAVDQEICRDHYIAMNDLDLGEFFSQDIDHYMFKNLPELDRFHSHPLVTKYGHSGASFAYMCREMQHISKSGWTNYVADTLDKYHDVVISC